MEIARVYSETLAVLDILGEKFIKKIPSNLYNKMKNEKSLIYAPKYDKQIALKNQNISKDTSVFLAYLHYNFWCDDVNEKQQIKNILIENEKNALNTINEINNTEHFTSIQDYVKKSHNEEISSDNMINNKDKQLCVVPEKKSIFSKIRSLIKRIMGDRNG